MSSSNSTLIPHSVDVQNNILAPLGTDLDPPFTESYTSAPVSCFVLSWTVKYNTIGLVPRVIFDGQLCRSATKTKDDVVYVGNEETRQEICTHLKLNQAIFPVLSHMASEILNNSISDVQTLYQPDGSLKSQAHTRDDRDIFEKRCGTVTRALATLLAQSINKAGTANTTTTEIVVAKPNEWVLVTRPGNQQSELSRLKRYTTGPLGGQSRTVTELY